MNFSSHEEAIHDGLLHMDFRQVELDMIPFTAHASTSGLLSVSHSRFKVSEDMYGRLRYALHAKIAGKDHPPITIKHPKTGWDSIKERWFPEWAKKKWPVQYDTLEINAKFLYPFLKVPLDDRPWVLVLEKKS